jgi:hypothetical protein
LSLAALPDGLLRDARVVVLAHDGGGDLLNHGLATVIVLHDGDLPAVAGAQAIPLTADGEVVISSHYHDGQLLRMMHWRCADAEKVVSALSRPTGQGAALTAAQARLLAGLSQGTVLIGAEWHTTWCQRLQVSDARGAARRATIQCAEQAVELATVLLTRGDTDGAVLAAHKANEATADAVLSDAGRFSVASHRRRSALDEVEAAGHPAARILTGARFWAVKCMQEYENRTADQWVVAVLRHCLTALAAIDSTDAVDDLLNFIKNDANDA